MINDVVLIGRITKDIELKSTGSGIAVAQFVLAVDRQFKNQDGEREADFISCVIWRKGAENLSKFTHKGSLIGIQGRLQTRSYDNKDGQRVYVTEVVIDHFSLLDSKKDSNNEGASNNTPAPQKHDSIPNAEDIARAKSQITQPTQPANQQPAQQPTQAPAKNQPEQQTQPTQAAPQATQAPTQDQSTQAPAPKNPNAGAIEDLFGQADQMNLDDDDLPF